MAKRESPIAFISVLLNCFIERREPVGKLDPNSKICQNPKEIKQDGRESYRKWRSWNLKSDETFGT
jgi:hypothetical protein